VVEMLQPPIKRPTAHPSVPPQKRLLRFRCQRFWSWRDGAGSAVLKIREESDAEPQYHGKVG
jgi:hypothetical protein